MAIPGILQQLVRNNPLTQAARQMLGMVNGAQSPQTMINQLMANNPRMREVSEYARQFGGDYQKAFYALAQQKGIDPNEILNMLK